MLILSRKQGETIQIGDNITVIVSKIGPNRVRVAVVAPREIPVRRGELVQERKSA